MAASSVAPMKTAPMAAIVMSISIENGVPDMAALKARPPIGTRPISIAARNAGVSTAGTSLPRTKAAASATPTAMVIVALAVRHHGVRAAGPASA